MTASLLAVRLSYLNARRQQTPANLIPISYLNVSQPFRPLVLSNFVCTLPESREITLSTIGITVCQDLEKWQKWIAYLSRDLGVSADSRRPSRNPAEQVDFLLRQASISAFCLARHAARMLEERNPSMIETSIRLCRGLEDHTMKDPVEVSGGHRSFPES